MISPDIGTLLDARLNAVKQTALNRGADQDETGEFRTLAVDGHIAPRDPRIPVPPLSY